MSFLKIFRADLPEVNTENKMLILASKSPRRKELMELLGVPFEIHQKDIDETPVHPLSPEETVRFLSAKKAEAVAVEHPFDLVLGVDTLVFAQGQILGKPKDPRDAKRMLRLLSGCTHTVFSGFTILGKGKAYSESVSTKVQFAPLSEEEIDRYIASGEPMDKAVCL